MHQERDREIKQQSKKRLKIQNIKTKVIVVLAIFGCTIPGGCVSNLQGIDDGLYLGTDSELVISDYKFSLDDTRIPRGFQDEISVQRFALDNNLLENTHFMGEPITYGELADILYRFKEYYPEFPQGFNDKVKQDDIDYMVLDQGHKYYVALKYTLDSGLLTTEQVSKPDEFFDLNILTRIIFNAGANALPFEQPTEEDIAITAEIVPELKEEMEAEDCPKCRVNKIVFLNDYDLLPISYRGHYNKERQVTKQDALNCLITFTDVLEVHSADGESKGLGCPGCAETHFSKERSKYSK